MIVNLVIPSKILNEQIKLFHFLTSVALKRAGGWWEREVSEGKGASQAPAL